MTVAGDRTAGAAAAAAAPPRAGRASRRLALALLGLLILASALLRLWYLPHSGRTSDERLAIENVQAALAGDAERDHRVAGLAWYPQYLLLRAADGIDDAGGGEAPVATAKGRVTRRGLDVLRLLSVLYGVAALPLLFLVARRLHSTGVALVATLALAFSPWHVQASVTYAPDILVLTLSLAALWLAFGALDRPSPGRLAAVGLALGAAAAAKVTGALVAPPVIVGLLLGGRGGWRRRLLPLAITLPAALAAFWALNPAWSQHFLALQIDQASQAHRAARELSSRFTVAVYAFIHPLRESVHGRLLGLLALLGAAGQAFRCLFLVDPGPARAHRLMVLSATPVFALGYAWATPLFRESGFVPLVAYSSLYAAVMLGTLWEGAVELLPRLRTRAGAVAAAALALTLIVPAGWSYVYSKAVPSTMGVAIDWVRRELGEGGPHVVIYESAALADRSTSAMRLAAGLALSGVPRLAEVDGQRLASADAELFVRRELEGADAGFYRDREGAGGRRGVFESRPLVRRGPDLVAVLHPVGAADPRPDEIPVETKQKLREGVVPPAAAGVTRQALLLRLPATPELDPEPPRAWLDGIELKLAPGGAFARETLFLTERLPASAAPRRLHIEPPGWMAARRGRITVASFSWR